MLFAKEKSPKQWTTADLDYILESGDNMYMSLPMNQKNLLIAELPKQDQNYELPYKKDLFRNIK